MRIKNNKIIVRLLDILVLATFFIPVMLDKFLRNKKFSSPSSILITEIWGIGDLVMMSSIIMPLRQRYPQARITLLSRDVGAVLFANNSGIDNFITFNFPWTKFTNKYAFWQWDWRGLLGTLAKLRSQKFDLAIDARGDIRNNLLSFLSAAKRRIGYSWTGGSFFLTDSLVVSPKGMHRVDAWLNILIYLGAVVEGVKPRIFVSKEEEIGAVDFLARHQIGNKELLVGIHPGAQIKSRCWPLHRFAELVEHIREELKAKIIVFIEPQGYGDDIPLRGDFIKAKLPLGEMIGLIQRLDLLICNDSGAMHIASALNIRTLSIFGPGDMTKIGPYGSGHVKLFDNNIDCRPCFDYCKFSKSKCLENISVETVFEAARNILKEKGRLS